MDILVSYTVVWRWGCIGVRSFFNGLAHLASFVTIQVHQINHYTQIHLYGPIIMQTYGTCNILMIRSVSDQSTSVVGSLDSLLLPTWLRPYSVFRSGRILRDCVIWNLV